MEIWKAVPSWPEFEVSDLGNVRRAATGRALRTPLTSRYPRVTARRDGRAVTLRVHTLVAEAFHGPRPEGMQVRHLNDVKGDNRAQNLAYGTSSQNRQDAVRNGRDASASRTRCTAGHPFSAENTYRLPSRPGTRICRTCKARRLADYLSQRVAAA